LTPNQTPISSIGEFGLIERLKEKISSLRVSENVARQVILGIDDDTAVTRPSAGMLQLATTDLLIEGVHFDLTYTSMRHLGWKLMVANLSDIAAMGGVPVHALISLALPAKITLEMVDELYEGILQAAQTYSCAILGGDTSTSLGNMVLAATITGEVPEAFIKRRTGARNGDLICVSGSLGMSHAGLKVLLREKERFVSRGNAGAFQPQLQEYTDAISRHLAPRARFDVSAVAAQHEWTHAMIDVSDGLASDLRHICTQSGVGARLYEQKLTPHPVVSKIAGEFNEPALDYVLFGGEEYELLFTIDPEREAELRALLPSVMVIGEITEEKNAMTIVQSDGSTRSIPSGGYNHFT
jgi:thiamine-monophosphate kinase